MRLTRLCVFLPLLFLASTLTAEILPPPQQVAPHSYAWIGPYDPPAVENRGFRMNLGFVVGSEAVAVIDSGYSSEMAREMLSHIRDVTDLPVRHVINTNSQPHRILGNPVFRNQGAEIIAGREAIPRMLAEGAAMAATAERVLELPEESIHAPARPDIAVEETMELDLGGLSLEITPVGTTHTAGSLIVRVPADNVIYTGDVLYAGRLLAVLSESHVGDWIAAYERLRDYPKTTLFVPGHGEPGKLSEFEMPTYDYLVTLKQHMDNAVDTGTYMQDAIDSLDQSAWQHLENFDLLSGRNAHRTYLERESAAFE
ncbi:Zn-dependent hydrolases [Thiohalobacter thiocyanaticus]|uniref:Zn-dependent hydrolases n=1 Tax=Thiohalobacter thiocyanaticus TaxID=585455 RepID=A0A1Z4VPZ2_9GAMM|nr:MBL fold metallo-hydrolase [Thiohalobacter thiocyanaticus]BAZ93709.1 Zn-dependent hydrolases [Thiohalobacter thiocyanaticus]